MTLLVDYIPHIRKQDQIAQISLKCSGITAHTNCTETTIRLPGVIGQIKREHVTILFVPKLLVELIFDLLIVFIW
ncbi:hypothetical protein CW304_10045 [Bacillus sp. UFRGS-B20]|nr:hypothetical protein CW304_10045 [Bacillus sp. UFRGS-B20]